MLDCKIGYLLAKCLFAIKTDSNHEYNHPPLLTSLFCLYFHTLLHILFDKKQAHYNFEIAEVDGAYSFCSVKSCREMLCTFQQMASSGVADGS